LSRQRRESFGLLPPGIYRAPRGRETASERFEQTGARAAKCNREARNKLGRNANNSARRLRAIGTHNALLAGGSRPASVSSGGARANGSITNQSHRHLT
jgi:hypothetical protein